MGLLLLVGESVRIRSRQTEKGEEARERELEGGWGLQNKAIVIQAGGRCPLDQIKFCALRRGVSCSQQGKRSLPAIIKGGPGNLPSGAL